MITKFTIFESSNVLPLIDAVKDQDYGLVNKLLQTEIDVNAQDTYGYTALMYASKNSEGAAGTFILEEIIEAGADLNVQNVNMQTALMLASIKNNTKFIKKLIQAGANLNIMDGDNDDFFVYLSNNERKTIMKYLEENFPEKYQDYLMKKNAKKFNI